MRAWWDCECPYTRHNFNLLSVVFGSPFCMSRSTFLAIQFCSCTNFPFPLSTSDYSTIIQTCTIKSKFHPLSSRQALAKRVNQIFPKLEATEPHHKTSQPFKVPLDPTDNLLGRYFHAVDGVIIWTRRPWEKRYRCILLVGQSLGVMAITELMKSLWLL